MDRILYFRIMSLLLASGLNKAVVEATLMAAAEEYKQFANRTRMERRNETNFSNE